MIEGVTRLRYLAAAHQRRLFDMSNFLKRGNMPYTRWTLYLTTSLPELCTMFESIPYVRFVLWYTQSRQQSSRVEPSTRTDLSRSSENFLPETAGAADVVVTTRTRMPGSSLKTYKKTSITAFIHSASTFLCLQLEFSTFHLTLNNEGTVLAVDFTTMVN